MGLHLNHILRGLAPLRHGLQIWPMLYFKIKMAIKRDRESERERDRERKKNTKYGLLAFKNVVVLGYNEV